ncbi:hypothetical protein ACFSUS_19340 [Spirosoma soli]|uniref:DUF600 family protein n=1 Tax=Spirosoma soli TaxID=1770529 RepID=A0ABW5M9D3_9BACT
MNADTIYTLLATAIEEVIAEPWTIAQLNVYYLASGHEVEFEGTYLDSTGEARQLPTEFSIEIVEAVQQLFTIRDSEGKPRANSLAFTISAQGRSSAEFTWDQEIQDEDDHFMNGGTVKEWIKIRNDKYGSSSEQTE